MTRALDTVKTEAQKQWGNDPAGAYAAGDAELGTPLSFQRVEADRYADQPWMHDTFRYEDHAGQRVLEVGVGLGTDHLQFARAGAKMAGIDLTPRCIELARRRFEQEGLESDLRQMDGEGLDFPDASFDCVYSFGVLHHTSHPEHAFREIRRVLRPGGVFMGALYAKYSLFNAALLYERVKYREWRTETLDERYSRIEKSTTDAAPLVRLLGGRELKGLLREAGFTDVRLQRRHTGVPAIEQRLSPRVNDRVSRIGGWYLVHHAR